MRRVAGPLLLLLLAGCGIAPSSSPSTPAFPTPSLAPSAGTSAAFASAVYPYEATVPDGWTAAPASAGWDGGDIDHTAPYADRLTDPDGNEYFVIGTAANGVDAATVADDHLAWLAESRGCPAPSVRDAIAIDGEPAVRAAVHCPEGVFGATLVSKAIAVHDGTAIIVTSFSPDDGSDALPAFDTFVEGFRWVR